MDLVVSVQVKSLKLVMNEPVFWEDYLINEPICKQFTKKWKQIRREVLITKFLFPKFVGAYPKFKISDLNSGKRIKLYENDWRVAPMSKFDSDYAEVNTVVRKAGKGKDLESLITKYRRWVYPTIHNIIKEPEREGILANVFVSILSPGTIIRPHQGYSKKYMRVHLCLIEDPQCKITVGDQTKTWKEGKILAFKDGGPYYHQVEHNGKRERYILSLDLKLNYLKQYIPIL